MRPRSVATLVLLLFLSLAGCKSWTNGLGITHPGEHEPVKGDTPEVLYEKGRYNFAAQNWETAEDCFEQLWENNKNHELAPDARFYAAESRYGREKYEGAFALYKSYRKAFPLSPHSPLIQRRLYDMGVYTIEAGQEAFFEYSDEGIIYLEYLVSAFPNGDLADDALLYMAEFEVRDDRSLDAIEHLKELLQFYPGSEWALAGRLMLARAYRKLNRGTNYDQDVLKRSVAEYRAYIDLVSRDPRRKEEYAELLVEANAELDAVIEALARKCLATANYYLRTNQPDAAKEQLRTVIKDFPNSEAAFEARKQLGLDDARPDASTNGDAGSSEEETQR